MQLYASKAKASRSARKYAHAHRPFGNVNLKSTTRGRRDESFGEGLKDRRVSLPRLILRRSAV